MKNNCEEDELSTVIPLSPISRKDQGLWFAADAGYIPAPGSVSGFLRLCWKEQIQLVKKNIPLKRASRDSAYQGNLLSSAVVRVALER
jgi:hypothetical protein